MPIRGGDGGGAALFVQAILERKRQQQEMLQFQQQQAQQLALKQREMALREREVAAAEDDKKQRMRERAFNEAGQILTMTGDKESAGALLESHGYRVPRTTVEGPLPEETGIGPGVPTAGPYNLRTPEDIAEATAERGEKREVRKAVTIKQQTEPEAAGLEFIRKRARGEPLSPEEDAALAQIIALKGGAGKEGALEVLDRRIIAKLDANKPLEPWEQKRLRTKIQGDQPEEVTAAKADAATARAEAAAANQGFRQQELDISRKRLDLAGRDVEGRQAARGANQEQLLRQQVFDDLDKAHKQVDQQFDTRARTQALTKDAQAQLMLQRNLAHKRINEQFRKRYPQLQRDIQAQEVPFELPDPASLMQPRGAR